MRYSTIRAFCSRELTGGRLIFWLIWYVTHLGLFAYGWYAQATNERLALLNTLRFSVWTSRGAGLVLALDGGLILLPVLRNILCFLRPRFRWLPLDDNVFFHKQVAYSIAFWSMVHTTAHYVNFYNVEATKARPVKAWQIHYTQVGGITGHIMLLCMVLMYVTAQIRIKRKCFEAFWYTHHLAFIFMLALYSHASGCFVRDTALPFSPFSDPKNFWNHCIGYQSFRYEIIVGLAYLAERIWREIRARRKTRITKVVCHPKGVIELQFKKPSMQFRPGQYLFLNIPDISKFQYHPFTITSAPQDKYLSVHIRQVGDWTHALAERLFISKSNKDEEIQRAVEHSSNLPHIRVDGPYGCPAQEITKYRVVVLCGAGIGITPWASILKDIYHRRRSNLECELLRVELIWICRDAAGFEWFQELLASLERDKGAKVQLVLHIYLTAHHSTDEINNFYLNDEEKDVITRLDAKTHFGRPNFETMLLRLRDQVDIDRIGVFFCGPPGASQVLRKACLGASSKNLKFEYHKERF